MKRIALSSVLLFSLVIFFVMQYRIGPGDTPIWLFGIIFALLLGYIVVDVLSLSQKVYDAVKTSLLAAIVLVVLGSGFSASMIVRHQTAPSYGVSDIILQQEAAIRYFVHGKNPYKETYFNTPMATFHYSDTEVNPALYHFVMEPFYLLFPLPFYVISNHLIGYFDAREVLWLLFGVLLVFAYFVPKEKENKRILITLLAFNPAMLGYALEGRSDIFGYAFLFVGFFLLQKKKVFWAGILIALSCAVKQSVFPLIPLYMVYLASLGWKETKSLQKTMLYLIRNLSGFIVVLLSILLPFFVWNPQAFLASTIYFLSGNGMHSYPVAGYGLGMLLHQLGIIKDVHAYYPFALWQIGIGLPILVILSWYLWKKPSLARLILFYAIFLFVFWYLARYFNNSHVGYISMVLITAYLWDN